MTNADSLLSFHVVHRRLLSLLGAWLWTVLPAGAATFDWNTGDGTWGNSALPWSPFVGAPPADGDSARLGNLLVAADAEVTLVIDTPALFRIDISDGVDLLTNRFSGAARAVQVSGSSSRLVVQSGSSFNNDNAETDVSSGGLLLVEDGGSYDTGELTLLGGGDAQLTGGFLEIGSSDGTGFLHVHSGSELVGWGTVFFGDQNTSNADLLVNDGTIRTSRPFPDLSARQALSLDTDINEADLRHDLDGTTESGSVSLAHTTTLTILGTLSDDFSSRIDMSSGSILNMSEPWTIDSGAMIDVDAVQMLPLIPETFARIEGGDLIAKNGSTINVHSGTLEVAADLTVVQGSVVNVMENGTLQLDGNTIFLSSYPLDLTQTATTLIVNDMTSMLGIFTIFDWDGNGNDEGHATTEVNAGALFEIDVGALNMGVDRHRYDGTLNVNGGTVDVRIDNDDTTPWIMNRNLNLANSTGAEPTITGNPLEIGNGDGVVAHLNVSGTGVSRMATDVTFRSDADVVIAAGAVLELQEGVVIDGGTLDLEDGEVTGGLIRNAGGAIRGNGRITSSSINNFGMIEANGGTLVIDTMNPAQLDGGGPNNGQGTLLAVGGDLEVASNVNAVFSGNLIVGPSHTFTMSRPGSRFRNAPATEDDDGSGDFGRIELDGGTIVATTFEQASQLTVTGIGTLNFDEILLEDGSLTEIVGATDQLRLRGNTIIEPGAEFDGSVLLNDAGSSLTIQDGADVEIRLLNGASLEIGNSPGAATLEAFIQFGTGNWAVEIGGTSPRTEYDRLEVTSDAQVAGTLAIEIVDLGGGLFAPSLGDTFEILEAQTVNGEFQSVDASLAQLTDKLAWSVEYTPTTVLLRVIHQVVLPGDYNGNGQVEQADLDLVLLNWGADGTVPPTGWTNDLPSGLIDQEELDGVLLNWGSGLAAASVPAGTAGPTGVPEPASAILLALGVVAAMCTSRQRCRHHHTV